MVRLAEECERYMERDTALRITKVFFVRHAQAEHSEDDRNRPLTKEGTSDSRIVRELLKDKEIDVFYCSPYRRSLDTIRQAAEDYHMDILVDERLRERKVGPEGHSDEMLRRRWSDSGFHEAEGESLLMVQKRNIEALQEILTKQEGKNIVIGTHGTALSSILNFFDPQFGYDDFIRIAAWMPYVIELDFERQKLISVVEHGYADAATLPHCLNYCLPECP